MSKRPPYAILGLAVAGVALATGAWLLRSAGCNARPATGLKVVVIGLDGAHTALLSPLLEQGRLPNLARFLERASGGIMTAQVHEGYTSPALWTTMVTGVEPWRHGIADFVLPHPGTCKDVLAASGHRTVPALWNLLSDQDIPSVIVGLWATRAVEPICGAMVSLLATYNRVRLSLPGGGDALEGVAVQDNIWPRSVAEAVLARIEPPGELEPDTLRRFADFSDAEVHAILNGEFTGNFLRGDTDPFQELKVTLQSDRSFAAIAGHLDAEFEPSLLWLYLEGIDVLEHKFWPYHDPDYAPAPPDRERFAQVINRYVEYTDELIAPYLAMAGEDTVVLVVSDHGYATTGAAVRPHWHNQNAILFAAGGPVRPGRILDPGEATLYDVTPTILALLGMPVGDDMPGKVLTELLDEAFLRRYPVRTIPTHGSRAPVPDDILWSEADEEFIHRLRQLGYIAEVGSSAPDQPIDLSEWQKTPCVRGRLATPCDVQLGRAAFVSDPRDDARPLLMPLPRCALYLDERGERHQVVVIQAESVNGRERIGFRHLSGAVGRAFAQDVEFLEGGF